MQGFDVEDFRDARDDLAESTAALNNSLGQQPALPATHPDLVSARGAVAADCGRLLSALGREPSDDDMREMVVDLEVLGPVGQQALLRLMGEAELVELQRQMYSDGWPSVPLPEYWPSRLLNVVFWRAPCCAVATLFIDVAALLGFPVFLGWLRVTLVFTYFFLVTNFVLHWFGGPDQDGGSSPAAAPAAAPALSAAGTARWAWGAISIAGTAVVPLVGFLLDKDLTERASAAQQLGPVATLAANMPARLPQGAPLQSLREALMGRADFCNATLQRDSMRLNQIKRNVVNWKRHPFRTLRRSVTGAVVSLKALFA